MKQWIASWKLMMTAALFLILIITFFYGAINKDRPHAILIGIPESAASLIFKYVLKEKLGENSFALIQFEPYALKDCCSSTTQWALSSGALDMAVMCPAAAERLINKDSRYIVVGPVIKNSDVFVVHKASYDHPITIAVSIHREHQRKMVENRYKANGYPINMLHSGIPYAYMRGVVDGAVIDIIKSYGLKGITLKADEKNNDFVTYVLVCNRTFQNTSSFNLFLKALDAAVEEMNDFHNLFYLLKNYEATVVTEENAKKWEILNIKFLHPSSNYPFE